MAKTAHKKPVAKTIVLGLATVGMYAAAFSNTDVMMEYFTKGGLYSALPIATVFCFSFVHGAFSSNLWTCCGITAKKPAKRVEAEATKRPVQDQRPRVSAQQA